MKKWSESIKTALSEKVFLVKGAKTKSWFFLWILLILFLLSYLMLFVLAPEMVNTLTSEDHLYENTQAVCNLLASVLFVTLFFKDKRGNDFRIIQTRKNVFFLLLALFFFFGFGEEISWGQRIFRWQTPALLDQINVQHETNIHNIEIFNHIDFQGNKKSFWAEILDFNRIFSIFWFVFCFVVPIFNAVAIKFSKWIHRLNLPVVPIWMGILFPLNYLTYKVIELFFINGLWRFHSEVKEAVFAILFATLSIWFLTEINKEKDALKA